jgi:hypothetical protein
MKYINNNDRAELVVDSPSRELRHSCYKELRYLSIFIGQRGLSGASSAFINKGNSIYKGYYLAKNFYPIFKYIK